jgi:predicted nucleotidyltransferase
MPGAVEQLSQLLSASWPNIDAARKRAAEQRQKLASILADFGTSDAAIVMYGSLARGEYTSGSDVDWTLLVDGPAKPDQRGTVRQVREALRAFGIKPPNPGGAFGSMSFSHELVHRIGGDADTNRITTQRVLLLLESVAVDAADQRHHLVHERVIRSVLDSYLEQHGSVTGKKVPRFLLNDVVRYWRTMTVDFAAKVRERGDEGWALRRLKLQTSRKLIFSAGLIMSLNSYVRESVASEDDELGDRARILEDLVSTVHETPLDRVARAALGDPTMLALVRPVFAAYEQFLAIIDDKAKRDRLDTIGRDEASSDAVFIEAREVGRAFGQAIEDFFFDSGSRYASSIRTYGVF